MTNQDRIDQLEKALLIAMNSLDRVIECYGDDVPCSDGGRLDVIAAKDEIERILLSRGHRV